MSLRKIISQLDWKASAKRANHRTHWRISVSTTLGAIGATYVFHLLYPDAFWFFVLWCGLATGFAVGLIPGALWQLASPTRVAQTSGKFLAVSALAGTVFALAAILFLGPMMRAQETERTAFRSLANEKVLTVAANGRCVAKNVTSSTAVKEFLERVGSSELYYPSHEGSVRDFTLSFVLAGGKSVEFAAGIPERHLQDLSVRTGSGEMLIQGARPLLGIEPDSKGDRCTSGCPDTSRELVAKGCAL